MGNAIKQLAVLGSSGSIGQQTLQIVRALPDKFHIVGLAAGQSTDVLRKQIDEFKPRFVYCQDNELRAHPVNTEYEFLSLEDIARHPEVDTVVIATSGKAGLAATLAAIEAGKRICLANKEALVMAGEIITTEAKEGEPRLCRLIASIVLYGNALTVKHSR